MGCTADYGVVKFRPRAGGASDSDAHIDSTLVAARGGIKSGQVVHVVANIDGYLLIESQLSNEMPLGVATVPCGLIIEAGDTVDVITSGKVWAETSLVDFAPLMGDNAFIGEGGEISTHGLVTGWVFTGGFIYCGGKNLVEVEV